MLADARPALAEELTLLLGPSKATAPSETTYTWALNYLKPIDDANAVSFTWLNEGHLTDHHRDGIALQYWRRAWFVDRRLALAAGIGPYLYFDTTPAPQGYDDNHGVGALFSLSATWYGNSRWFYQTRLNHVAVHHLSSTSLMLGVGYQLDLSPAPATGSTSADGDDGTRWWFGKGDQLTVLTGRTIVNSLRNPNANAQSVEYRHSFSSTIDGSLAWIDQGHTPLTRRNGLAAQIWYAQHFAADRLKLALGLGPYVAFDSYRTRGGQENGKKVTALLTMMASYQLTGHWDVQASWHRVFTGYDRDSDIFLAGIGYRF